MIYVHSSWLIHFVFTIHTSLCAQEFRSLGVPGCPTALLGKVQAGKDCTSSLPDDVRPTAESRLLQRINDLAAEPSPHYQSFPGYFSPAHNYYLFSLFQKHGSVPWQSVIESVMEAWLESFSDSNLHPRQKYFPLGFHHFTAFSLIA